MADEHEEDLTVRDVDSLLADFLWLKRPAAPSLPQRDERLWRQAINEAWKAEEEHAKKVAAAVSIGSGGKPGAVMDELAGRKAIRAAHEKQTGKPSTVGFCDRFKNMPEQVYRRLDPAYAKADAEARRKAAEEVAAIRKRVDLLLVSVKTPLLELSELAASTSAGQAWRTYLAAIQYHGAEHRRQAKLAARAGVRASAARRPPAIDAVIQDLERIKAKLQSHQKRPVRLEDVSEGKATAGQKDGDGTAMPAPEDVEFFEEIGQHIKANPEQYREAGGWLDREYGNEAFWRRERHGLRELIRKEKAGTLSPGEREALRNIRSWSRGSPERKRRTFLELRRFAAATKPYFEDPPAFLREVEARRVLLMTWLMTDADADQAGLELTEFENWPWEAEDDEAHLRSRRFASDWWRYPSEGYQEWRGLAERAWAKITTADELRQTSDGSKRRGRWTKTRAEREVEGYWSSRTEQYNRLVPLVLAGDPQATEEFQETFGPTAIARALAGGCKKQNVQQTQTYAEKIQPLFKKPPRPPANWMPPEQDDSELGNTIAQMHKRAKGGR